MIKSKTFDQILQVDSTPNPLDELLSLEVGILPQGGQLLRMTDRVIHCGTIAPEATILSATKLILEAVNARTTVATPSPVSEVLKAIPSHHASLHPLTTYINALDSLDLPPAIRFLRAGGEFLVLELVEDKVLKIGLQPALTRPLEHFDCPLLEEGEAVVNGTTVFYHTQPKISFDVSFEELTDFLKTLESVGFRSIDIGGPSSEQVGKLSGRLVLSDYRAVTNSK